MGDHQHHHHRPQRLTVPPRTTTRTYPLYPQTPTPSKHRNRILSGKPSNANKSLSSLLIHLFSLRSLYTILPFLRSSPPTFSLFPFTFLVSLLALTFSLLLSLSTNLFSPKQRRPIFDLGRITNTQNRILISRSGVITVVFLLRFQALRYCGTAAMILAELAGNVVSRFWGRKWKVGGVFGLVVGLGLLSVGYDRVGCFPGFRSECVRIWPMVLPFLSGFLGAFFGNNKEVRELGKERARLVLLFYSTVALFVPAVLSVVFFEGGDVVSVSVKDLAWPLVNTAVFGVLLSESYGDEKGADFRTGYLVTFVFMVFWELFYYPELSLWGLLICCLLIYFGVRELGSGNDDRYELGLESEKESYASVIMKPVRQILSERKSRKIALFLLINTGYMVVEFVAGFMSNSLGLISDACHMLFDCAALAIGLYASYISRLPANSQFNFGRGRFEVLSGYVNAVLLVLVGALIVLESIERILDPQDISTNSLLVVSVGGLVVNVIGLIFFHEEHHHAHGGSCSHSHSHSHGHSHSHHDHHHYENHGKHQDIDNSSSDHQHCGHDHHTHGSDHDGHTHQHNHSDQVHHRGHQNNTHQHSHSDCQHGHADHNAHNSTNSQSLSSGGHSDSHGAHSHCSHSQLEEKPSDSRVPQKKDKHQHMDHNMEGIFLHVLADTLGSVGVVVSTLLIKYKGWLIADPASSIFISVMIISSVIPLLKNSIEVLLQKVPRTHEMDIREALRNIKKIKGVCAIQNLHVWSFTNADVVATLHLHVSKETDKGSAKAQVSHLLEDAGIKDLTLQVECVE